MTIAGPLGHWKKTWHWIALRAVLALAFNSLSLPERSLKHWKLSWTATSCLVFTAEDWLVTAFSLTIKFNWSMRISTLNALGRAFTLKFTVQDEIVRTDPTGKVNVEITGLPIGTDGVTLTITGTNWDWDWHRDLLMHWLSIAMLTEFLKSWQQARWGIVIFNTCTLHHVWHLTVHVDYRLFFVTDFARFRSLHVLSKEV